VVVDHKGNKQWVWLAMDRKTREIVGFILGNEAKKGQKLVEFSTSCISTMCCLLYRFFETGSLYLFPTNHKDLITAYKFSRLVRKTLSFSKQVENHIGAIWYFIHHYNSLDLLSLHIYHYP